MLDPSESEIQKGYFQWVRLKARGDPRYNLIFSSQAGVRFSTIMQAKKAKAEGMAKGAPDVIGLVPSYEFHGFVIEFKSAKGKLSLAQKCFLNALANLGYSCHICRSMDEGINQTQLYMRGAKNVPIVWEFGFTE